MDNINYPTWESGICQLLPEVNPYDDSWYIGGKADREPEIWTDGEIGEFFFSPKFKRLKIAWSYQEILKWLREEHKIHIVIKSLYAVDICNIKTETDYYIADVDNKPVLVEDDGTLDCYFFTTYEEAIEEGIKLCLNDIKTKP